MSTSRSSGGGGGTGQPPALQIAVDGGNVPVSEAEKAFFDRAFLVADQDCDDMAAGREAAAFLRRSGLDDAVLGEVRLRASPRRSGAVPSTAAAKRVACCVHLTFRSAPARRAGVAVGLGGAVGQGVGP